MRSISVIIPVYNTSAYLRACLDSTLQQREHVCQIILVDDGSTDESGQIRDEYAQKWPELVIAQHQLNQGSSAARNRSIELAAGRFLSFIDSDDYIEPDMYVRPLDLTRRFDSDMLTLILRFLRTKQPPTRCGSLCAKAYRRFWDC